MHGLKMVNILIRFEGRYPTLNMYMMNYCTICGGRTKSELRICSKHKSNKVDELTTVKLMPMQTYEKRLKFLASEFKKLANTIPEFDEADKDEQASFERVQTLLSGINGISFSRDSSVSNFYEFDSAFSTDNED